MWLEIFAQNRGFIVLKAGKWMNSEDQHLLAQVDVSKCCFWSNNEEIIVRSVNFCQLSEKIKLPHENFGYFFSNSQDWEVSTAEIF